MSVARFYSRIQDYTHIHVPHKHDSALSVSSVSMATGQTAGVRFTAGPKKNVSFFRSTQTGSAADSVSYPLGTRDPFSGNKAARGVKLTTHFHLVLKSRMVDIYITLPHVFVLWLLILYTQG
jgi:hypothetical protein